ncbi:MAG TPA: DNA polymerase III subunit delta' [Actinomycetales bacterium]|nr:DNA polymerase III subunit delta' [Actinomycetales bacterium]
MSVWDEVVGQERVIASLDQAARSPQAMTHSWLLTGPPGSGRSNAARAFAAALQCEHRENPGCGLCSGCTMTLAGSHPDVTVLTTSRVTITIDEVRHLVGLAARSPGEGNWRIIIIEDADRMPERTSNVLLKSIEEPPARTVWILCAPSPQDVVVTIRSRCRTLTLKTPAAEEIADLLVRRDNLPHAAALEAARASQHHIGLARRLAGDAQARERRANVLRLAGELRGVGDAVLAAADLVEISANEAKAMTEERDASEKESLLRTLGAEEGTRLPPALRTQMRQLEEDQKRRATRAQRDVLDRMMTDLLSLYRDVLLTQLGAEVEHINATHHDLIAQMASQRSTAATIGCMDAIGTARERLAANVTPLLALEAMLIALRPQRTA